MTHKNVQNGITMILLVKLIYSHDHHIYNKSQQNLEKYYY